MNEWSAKDLELAMRQHLEDEGNDYDYFCNYGHYYRDEGYSFELPGFGTVETVEGQGMYSTVHGEPSGSYTEWEVYFVVKVDGRFFKFSGHDSSWDSPGIENVEEVEPVEKVYLDWEPKHDY